MSVPGYLVLEAPYTVDYSEHYLQANNELHILKNITNEAKRYTDGDKH